MDDLDQLLSDLENVSTKSKATTRNSLKEKDDHDYIKSINRIVNTPNLPPQSIVKPSTIKQGKNNNIIDSNTQRMGSLTTLATNTSSNYSITNEEFDDEDVVNANSSGSNLNLNIDSPSASNSRIADLTELDSLLDDLYQAKQKLANAKNQNPIEILNSTKNKRTSQLPQNSSSNWPALVSTSTTGSGSESASSSSYSPVSSLNQTQTRISQQLANSRISVADAASKELEFLMRNLSMYKNDSSSNQENEIPIYFEKKEQFSINNNGENVIDLRNSCFSCKEIINGQVITALGYLWHPNHFVCFHCNNSIGTSIFYEKDNLPYCEKDYLNLFSPKCASCTLPILDKMLTALNKTWHIQCFKCLRCKRVLNDESFLEINNEAYCKECYVEELAPKCKRCAQAIIENFISALDFYWHPNCFVCQECGIPFNNSSFYEHNSIPYCEIHYHLKRGSLCAGCHQPINGRCITALNKKYHPEHFNCSFCLKQLNKGTFKEQNEKPYCNGCFLKLFP